MQIWVITGYGQNFLFQNQSFFRPYLTNPALAGIKGKGNLGIIYKKQLAEFENSPNSQAISIDYPFLRNSVGLGFNLFKDQNGPSSYLGFESTFAYHVITSKKYEEKLTGFSFGLSANINQFTLDRQYLMGEGSDDAIFNDDSNFNDISPNANIGFNFFSDGFSLGASVYNLLSLKNTVYKETNDLQRAFTVFLSTSIEWIVKEQWIIRPALLLRTQKNADYQVDIMSEFGYKSLNGFSFSLTPLFRSFSYRTVSGNQSVGLNSLISKYPFSLGYQFDVPISGNYGYAGDHVFFIAYQLGSKPKVANKKS